MKSKNGANGKASKTYNILKIYECYLFILMFSLTSLGIWFVLEKAKIQWTYMRLVNASMYQLNMYVAPIQVVCPRYKHTFAVYVHLKAIDESRLFTVHLIDMLWFVYSRSTVPSNHVFSKKLYQHQYRILFINVHSFPMLLFSFYASLYRRVGLDPNMHR